MNRFVTRIGKLLGPVALTCSLVLPTGAAHAQNDSAAMTMFTHRANLAGAYGAVGAFPNMHSAWYGMVLVGGTVFVKSSVAEWRDVPLAEMGSPPLNDFGARMRAANVYATRNGFVGAFPTYHHADYGRGIVSGIVLLRGPGVEWRDIPLAELGYPALNDIGARFRATADWAARHGYVGGFPNMFHADYGRGIVCGTVLLKPGYSEWRDVVLQKIN
jgi:hypothetical protein